MPLKGFVASMDVKTNEIKNIPIGLLNENQSELSDYLICTLFEKSDGSAITMQHICEMESSEYKKMETKVKEINPFGVFDIKAF